MRSYLSLPIQPDEGFPQAFRLSFGGQVYQLSLYVNVAEDDLPNLPDPMDLPAENAQAFLVLRVARESAGGAEVIFRRRLVCNLEYEAGEIAFRFTRIQIAKGNLNGVGAFGSRVEGGITARWA